MNESISHRGPDDGGVFFGKIDTYQVALGQRRLSIIDLSEAGHQPMYYEKTKGASNDHFHPGEKYDSVIVFNGEIYNHLDIQNELVEKGYVFSTHSDTEVILASYDAWGMDCVERFNGMWAFVLFDTKKNHFFCSRDRFGKKPLYYYHMGSDFIFSSEIKGILAHTELQINTRDNINTDAVDFYFTMGNIPAPLTIYQNVSKLQAGHNLIITIEEEKIVLKDTQYYLLPDYNPVFDRGALIKEGRILLDDATKIRMFSADVPVGAFLSGGLDSSSVVAMMTKYIEKSRLHTFSIGFEGKYDETRYINIMKEAFGTNNHHKYFREKDFSDLQETFLTMYDEPFADTSGFPMLFVSKLAHENVTVALSGDGGDEVFGGYSMHQVAAQMDLLYKIPFCIRTGLFRLTCQISRYLPSLLKVTEALRLSCLPKHDFYAELSIQNSYKPESYKKWTGEKMKQLLEHNKGNFIQSIIDFDLMYNTLADNFLTKVDRASMAYALEIRSPFLDYRFIEYSRKIPTKWKVTPFRTKILMRDIIRGIVPDSILKRGKKGFSPPILDWIMKDKYIEETREGLNILLSMGVMNPLLNQFLSRIFHTNYGQYPPEYTIRLFLFYRWYKQWIK